MTKKNGKSLANKGKRMKKLIMGMAAIAAGSLMAIESSNIVGYSSHAVEQGKWAFLAVQFEGVDGKAMDVNDAIKGDFSPASEMNSAAFIQVWNGNGYDSYYFLDYALDEDFEEYENVWADGEGMLVTFDVTPGTTIWFKNPSEDCTVTFAGQVTDVADAVSYKLNTWNLVANPRPVALDLNAGAEFVGMTSADDLGSASFVQTWNGNGYDTYYYLAYVLDEDFEEYEDCWADGEGMLMTYEIPQGAGFWLKPLTGTAINFK